MRAAPLALCCALLAGACAFVPLRPAGPDTEFPAELPAEAERVVLQSEAPPATTGPAADARPTRHVTLPPAVSTFGYIPLQITEPVLFWLDYFRRMAHASFERGLHRMATHEDMIREQLRNRGMPEELIYLPLVESNYVSYARSHAGAVGLWQFMPATARLYGLRVRTGEDERQDPARATAAALDYLQDLYAQFGSWYLALAAYNTGAQRVERAVQQAGGMRGRDALFWEIDHNLPTETRHFIPKFIAAAILAGSPRGPAAAPGF